MLGLGHLIPVIVIGGKQAGGITLYFLQSQSESGRPFDMLGKREDHHHGMGLAAGMTDQVWGSRCVGWVRHCQSMALQVISMGRLDMIEKECCLVSND